MPAPRDPPSVRLPEIILALEMETKKGKLHDKASQRVGDQTECPRPFPGMGLNTNIFSPPPTWWTQAPGNQACCMEPDGEGLLPRLGVGVGVPTAPWVSA